MTYENEIQASVSVDKVLLEPRHAHRLRVIRGSFPATRTGVSSRDKPQGLPDRIHLLSGPLRKRFADPWSGYWVSTSIEHWGNFNNAEAQGPASDPDWSREWPGHRDV